MLPLDRRWRVGGTPEITRGEERSCRRGAPCDVSHGVTPLCGNYTASGAYSSNSRRRGGPKAAALPSHFLNNHVHLEGQRPSDTMGQYNS